ncbi:hypothetical protein F5050DRAFT_1573497 [Lentinula boryana]|uniref:F-box domain-containing protein n=1 Tax=Lentinula boryana TaxID=40481 RepID=A0ABQ8QAA6_9AGAR|nr:hypothetical protein F5050DRAFT_1573497 [Lentinula boryana]
MLRTLSRTSSKPKKFSVSVPTLYIVASGDEIAHTRPSPRIPLELIELVLSFLSWGICTRSTLSLAFTSGFALASRTFREIVFKNFFRSIFLQDACWDRTLKLLSISQARALDTCPMYIVKDCMELRRLTGLEHLRLNFEKEGLQTQHPICQRLFPNLASSKLSSLIIDMIPRIDRTLLSLISRSFPCLKVLKLSVTERLTVERDCFCRCCFEDVLECCVHSPIPDSYGDVSLLAQSYAAALQHLFQLIELQLGVFLSEERMVYQHMVHPDEQDTNCIATSPSTCAICEMFRHETRIQEEIASRIVFENLPNLRQIRWSTFFDRPCPENGLQDEMSFRIGWATFERKDESLVRL